MTISNNLANFTVKIKPYTKIVKITVLDAEGDRHGADRAGRATMAPPAPDHGCRAGGPDPGRYDDDAGQSSDISITSPQYMVVAVGW